MKPTTVILNGAGSSQSELLAESKDPIHVSVKTGISRNSPSVVLSAVSNVQREYLAASLKHSTVQGSFDCVIPALRRGNYFAQDDSEIV